MKNKEDINIEEIKKEIDNLNWKASNVIESGKKLNGKAKIVITKSKRLFLL